MKFDPFSWSEKKNGEVKAKPGRVQILLSSPGALYATCQGVESLVGYGASFDLEIQEEMTFRADVGPKVRVFVQMPRAHVVRGDQGEKFFNIDKLPVESGSMTEVRKAERHLQLKHRAMLRELREEEERFTRLRVAREDVIERAPEPPLEQVSAVKSEDAAE